MIIILILDYLLIYYIPSYFSNLNLLYPMLTLVYIIFLYHKMPYKKYLKRVILIGFIYDLLFSYIFLFNTLLFLFLAKIMKKINRYIRYNMITDILFLIFFIFLYDFILFILVNITYYNKVNIGSLFYKFKNSIILNLIFYFLLVFLDGKLKGKDNYRGKLVKN